MPGDLSQFLNEWPFQPDEVLVRIVSGDDGQPKIQLRVDLGILQMELNGRPDGDRPEGFDSWFEYYQHKQRQHDETHPDAAPFALNEQDCMQLWRESVQYYHRYLSLWHLNMYDLCARDTARNLRMFAFVRAHAQDDRHKVQFDQWRPYSLMMLARATATPLVERQLFDQAIEAIDNGIESIREFLDDYDQSSRAEECVELVSLERWREEVAGELQRVAESRPKTELEILRQKLDEAIAAEAFEDAARLRDEIRSLGESQPPDPES